MQHSINLWYSAVILLLFTACRQQSSNNNPLALKPTAMGRINDVVILADQNIDQTPLGDMILSYFEAPYPILTADEPIFNVRFMSPEDLLAKPLRKELRTFVLIADVSDTTSSTTKMLRSDLGEEKFKRTTTDPKFITSIGKEKWAKDQLIIYIFANGKEKLYKAISDNFEAVAKRINQHDEKNLNATVYGIQSVNKVLSKLALDSFGIQIKIPGLYNLAMQKPNFLWIRMDNKEINQSIIIRKFPYKDNKQFEMGNIIRLRNEYGKEFIRTGQDSAYMSTNVIDLPTFEYTYVHNNVYTKEVRGIWETVHDFMGGPFVSYMLHNEAKGEVVFIDVFVFAPGKDKRDLVQQLDCIVKTATFPGVVKK
jgi:hypothetical protein